MLSQRKPVKQYYSEIEAAQILCITVEDLHEILDEHVFAPEDARPEEIELTYADLVLLSVWAQPERGYNVVEMPHRI